MPSSDDTLRTLREALRLSPDNLPLRQHLADTLLHLGRFAEAEAEYREGLAHAPHRLELKCGLADAFYQQAKHSAALVIVEELLKNAASQEPPPRIYLLHARLMLRAGDTARAARAYQKAVAADPALADPTLAEQLGVPPRGAGPQGPGAPFQDEDDRRVPVAGREEPEGPSVELERPKVSFAHVGGMEDLKDEIRMKIIHPLTHPEIYKAYGKAIGGGILLYGPPGCGKTHLARATAGEVKAGFIAVGIHDILDMWLGNSERNLHEVFAQARAHAPCVLFFDEVDALGASRTDMRHSGARHLINQFLSELDGMQASNDGLLILAATNAPWHLDAAFRRPGRFDRVLFVPPPDAPARAAILRILLSGKPAQDVDYDYLAKKTDQFSGADLKAVVDQAIEAKLKEALTSGIPAPLTSKDLAAAAKGLRPTTSEWFATARNYALYANQGGAYDAILKYLKLV